MVGRWEDAREAQRRRASLCRGIVAGSRNEICVTRGPTSPRLAPPLLSSVRLDAVPVSAPGRVAARCVILFNYVIPVIRARRREPFLVVGGRKGERCKRETIVPSDPLLWGRRRAVAIMKL